MYIQYKAGYKYQLHQPHSHQLPFKPANRIQTEYLWIGLNGLLVIEKGYCWDGPSGPTIDTKNFMRGSLIHDACYQLMRMGLLPQAYRKSADDELRRICLEDGMSPIRAWWVYRAVRRLAGRAADTGSVKKVLTAP